MKVTGAEQWRARALWTRCFTCCSADLENPLIPWIIERLWRRIGTLFLDLKLKYEYRKFFR